MSKFEKNSVNTTSNSLGASVEKHLNQYFDPYKNNCQLMVYMIECS